MARPKTTEEIVEQVTEEVVKTMTQAEVDALEAKRIEQEEKERQAWLNEKVEFKAIYDGDTYKDDIIVTINGRNYQIQRGKKVMIPRFVYMAIDQAERQLMESADNLRGLVNRYENEVVGKF